MKYETLLHAKLKARAMSFSIQPGLDAMVVFEELLKKLNPIL